MKNIINFVLIFGFGLILFAGCNIIEAPFEENPTEPIDTVPVPQNVLLEDFTGHTCGNCPAATDIAKTIEKGYGSDKVIIVAIHAGGFARTNDDYPTDFRTPEGTALDDAFRISRAGNPNGLVNRVSTGGKIIKGKDEWAPAVASLLKQNGKVLMSATATIDTTNNAAKRIQARVRIEYTSAGSADYHLVGWLLEDDIISDQTDYRFKPDHIQDYEFDHVLRASFNGTWGQQLADSTVPKGTVQNIDFTYTIPADKLWVPKNCSLVFYVHKHNTTREVVQVTKCKLTIVP